MAEDPLAKAVIDEYGRLKALRSGFTSDWQDLVDLVRPHTSDFNANSQIGQNRAINIFDGTALDALETFGSGMQTFMTSPTSPWFQLAVSGLNEDSLTQEERVWLEDVTSIMMQEYSEAHCNFYPSVHEAYLDIGTFGTGCVMQTYNLRENHLQFRTYPLASVMVDEDYEGKVDKVYRCMRMTRRQIIQMFPGVVLPTMIDQAAHDRTYEVIHCVEPAREEEMTPVSAAAGFKFKSVWVLRDGAMTLKMSGFQQFPYHIGRWTKLAGETYGRGPGMLCIADIRLLNTQEKTLLRAVQKMVDPPLIVPDDGFLLPLNTHPGGIILKDAIEGEIVPLETPSNIPVTLEIMEQKREHIRRCFHRDLFHLGKERLEMTAFEVQQRLEEKLRILGPTFGRLADEFLGTIIRRSFRLLNEQGRLPIAPGSLNGAKLTIDYQSPAARAQQSQRAVGMAQFIQDIVPLEQAIPGQGATDAINVPEFVSQLARIRGINPRVLRSVEEIQAMQQARQEKQQVAEAAATLEPASAAIKNIAQAQQVGNVF